MLVAGLTLAARPARVICGPVAFWPSSGPGRVPDGPVVGADLLADRAAAGAHAGHRPGRVRRARGGLGGLPGRGVRRRGNRSGGQRFRRRLTACSAGTSRRRRPTRPSSCCACASPPGPPPGRWPPRSGSWQPIAVFTSVSGPLNANRTAPTAAQVHRAVRRLRAAARDTQGLSRGARSRKPGRRGRYESHRASGSYVSADGRTISFATSLAAGNATSTAAGSRRCLPSGPRDRLRGAGSTDAAARRGDRAGGVHLRRRAAVQRRPGDGHPDRRRGHRGAARAGDALADRAAVPDRLGGALLLRRPRADRAVVRQTSRASRG